MSSNIFFQPFVGKDYANGGIFGKRIMILGESHYCDESCTDCGDCQLHRECMNFTQQVLGDYLNENKERQNWMRTFLKFERSLVGEETNQAMRLKIWNSVIFFNYLQVAMGGGFARLALPSNITKQARHSLRSSKSTNLSTSSYGARGFGIICLAVTGAKSKFLMFTGWIVMTSKWKAPGCLMDST